MHACVDTQCLLQLGALLTCAGLCCLPLPSMHECSRTWESNFSREGRLWMSSSCAGGAGGSDRLAAGGREAMLLLMS